MVGERGLRVYCKKSGREVICEVHGTNLVDCPECGRVPVYAVDEIQADHILKPFEGDS